MTYSRPVAATDLDYEIAWTDSLGSPWRTTGVTQEIVADDGWHRIIRAALFRGALGQRFVRLRIVQWFVPTMDPSRARVRPDRSAERNPCFTRAGFDHR